MGTTSISLDCGWSLGLYAMTDMLPIAHDCLSTIVCMSVVSGLVRKVISSHNSFGSGSLTSVSPVLFGVLIVA